MAGWVSKNLKLTPGFSVHIDIFYKLSNKRTRMIPPDEFRKFDLLLPYVKDINFSKKQITFLFPKNFQIKLLDPQLKIIQRTFLLCGETKLITRPIEQLYEYFTGKISNFNPDTRKRTPHTEMQVRPVHGLSTKPNRQSET